MCPRTVHLGKSSCRCTLMDLRTSQTDCVRRAFQVQTLPSSEALRLAVSLALTVLTRYVGNRLLPDSR